MRRLAFDPPGPAPSSGRRSSRAAGSLALLLALAGCADTVRPVLGGLRIGAAGGAFQMPVLENESLPFEYPADAWRERVGGETIIKIHISRLGVVDSVFVVRPSGVPSLDSAAVAGSRKLRYRPARQGKDPVEVWATLPVRYPLPEEIRTYDP